MKEFQRFSLMGAICLYLLIYMPYQTHAQTLTARSIATGPHSGGFWEYLPAGYSSTGSQTWPVIFVMGGDGENGSGSAADLNKLLAYGPAKMAHNGTWPGSFTVNGNTYSPIVITPQFDSWPEAPDVDLLVKYILTNYKVDLNRVYMTGLSQGGAVTWGYPGSDPSYAQRFAALLPICGAIGIDDQITSNLANNDIAIFATHDIDDPTVAYTFTVSNVNSVNGDHPAITAQDTIFPAGNGHDAWDNTLDPTHLVYKNQLNAYQWMLQFARNVTVPLPVKLTAYTAALAGDGSSVNVDWTTALEQNNNYFIIQRSGTGSSFQNLDTVPAAAPPDGGYSYVYNDAAPLAGNNFYRLEQVDKDGKATWFGVLEVTVGSSGKQGLQVSPNPVVSQAYLHLEHPATGALQVSLTDMQGRVIRAWAFQKQGAVWDQTIDLGGIASGSYVLQVKGTSIRMVKTIIKE